MPIVEQHKAGRQAVTPHPSPPITPAELEAVIGGRADTSHLLETAWALTQREAPGAPDTIKREAIIRFAGYLAEADFGGLASETIGPRTITWTVNHAPMFRSSGAKGLLAPWKVWRAGVIG